jgi:pimeloyl-ACP methyl ester carboxylesterase
MSTAYLDHVYTAAVGDTKLRYVRVGSGTPVVLLHTLSFRLEYFFNVLDQLDPARFDLIVPDLPGHGHSDAPRRDYTAMFFADHIEGFLDVCELNGVILTGESIGASIALELAARRNPRVDRVVALNPYDYGRRGGIRRSSGLANVAFTAMLWPGIGPVVAASNNRRIIRHILTGGFHDPTHLPERLVDAVVEAGRRRGHPYAFRSLMRNWRTWIDARAHFSTIAVPVTLSYGHDDWSRLPERDANAQEIPGVRTVTLNECGHFSSVEKPHDVARLIEGDI